MTPEELKALREALGASQAALARALGVGERQVRRWLAGDARVPPAAAILIRAWAAGELKGFGQPR